MILKCNRKYLLIISKYTNENSTRPVNYAFPRLLHFLDLEITVQIYHILFCQGLAITTHFITNTLLTSQTTNLLGSDRRSKRFSVNISRTTHAQSLYEYENEVTDFRKPHYFKCVSKMDITFERHRILKATDLHVKIGPT